MSDDRTYTLADAALLAVLNIARYDGRKLDRAATARAIASHGAQDGAASLRKQTISRDALAEIRVVSNEARTFHYTATFPWSYGRGLIPSAKVLAYRDSMAAYQRRFYAAVDRLLADIPAVIEDARARLGEMFDEADYPSPIALRRKFEFGFGFESVPSNDFRCAGDLRDELAAHARRDERGRLLGLVWSQVEEPARTLCDRLRAYKPAEESTTGKAEGVFRASTHTKLTALHSSLACIFPADTRGALGDDDLETALQLLGRIAHATTEALRDDTQARHAVAADAWTLAELCRRRMGASTTPGTGPDLDADPADYGTTPGDTAAPTPPLAAGPADEFEDLGDLDADTNVMTPAETAAFSMAFMTDPAPVAPQRVAGTGLDLSVDDDTPAEAPDNFDDLDDLLADFT